MANRLTQTRRKCIKTQNIFRERQEYSSLYTISSQSVLSVPSSEIMSSRNIVPNQSNQNTLYRGLQHKGDFVEDMQGQRYNYPKLPNDVSMELQQKVYCNSQRNYFNGGNQFTNNRFDDMNLENSNNRPQYPKPYCPMHISANRYSAPQTAPKYAINRLEESYWATWKPKNVGAVEPRQNFDHTELRNRQSPPPRYVATSMMAHECMAMLSQTKKRPVQSLKFKFRNEKPLQIIREPGEMHESNSSDMETAKKAQSKKSKSKRSCCTCPTKNESDSDEERSSKSNEQLESSQEERDKLYNEMFMECETDLMNWINDYEMQREHEEMQEMERQLVKEELMRRFEEQTQLDHDSVRYQDDIQVMEINSQTNDLMAVQRDLFSSRESIGSAESEQQNGALISPKQSLRNSSDVQQQGQLISPKQSLRDSSSVQQKDNLNSPKQSLRNTPNVQQKQVLSPKQSLRNSQNDQQENKLTSPKQSTKNSQTNQQNSEPTNPKGNGAISSKQSLRSSSNSQQKQGTSSHKHSPRNSVNIQQNGKSISPKHSPRSSANERQSPRNEELPSDLREGKEIAVTNPSPRTSRPTTPQRPLVQSNESDRNEKEQEKEAIDSAEYSEPDISIIKHTDSFIINSRRQTENRPRKPQPKFLKLTKTTFSSPPVKGHTYPLKSVLKKEKTQTTMGFGRTLSPISAKVKPPGKQNLPPYLLRYV